MEIGITVKKITLTYFSGKERKRERELHLLGTDTCYGKINDLLPWRVSHRESCEVLCVNQCFELTLPWTVNRLDIIMITDSK